MNQHFTLLIRVSVKYFKYSLEDLTNERQKALKNKHWLWMFFVLEMVSEGALLIEVYKTTIKALKKHEGPKIATLDALVE